MLKLALATLMLAAVSFAQSTTPQTPPPGAQPTTGTGAAQGQPGPGMRRPPMRMQMEQMQAQIDQMQKLIDQLKTDSAAIQDSAGKKVADDNVALWQALLDHMKQMGPMMHPPRRMPPTSQPPPKQ